LPPYPGRHLQTPSWQYPLPKQFSGQIVCSQPSPSNPKWQWQVAFAHTPLPEQLLSFPGQHCLLQSAPHHPFEQEHVRESIEQLPVPLQGLARVSPLSPGQAARWQLKPPKPGLHSHLPSHLQRPRALHKPASGLELQRLHSQKSPVYPAAHRQVPFVHWP